MTKKMDVTTTITSMSVKATLSAVFQKSLNSKSLNPTAEHMTSSKRASWKNCTKACLKANELKHDLIFFDLVRILQILKLKVIMH